MASPSTIPSPLVHPCSDVAGNLAPPVSSFAPLRISLIITLLLVPLAFGAVQEWAWGSVAVVAFLLSFVCVIIGARQGHLKIFWSPLYAPAVLFLIVRFIQFAARLTIDSVATRESLLKLVTDFIFFFIAGQLFSDPPQTTRHVYTWAIPVYTFLLTLLSIFQFFPRSGQIYWVVTGLGWTFGPYVNHNQHAGLMEMLIPISVACMVPPQRKHFSSLLLGFVITVPIASVLLSGSHGGFFSLIFELLLAAALILRIGPRHAPKLTAFLEGTLLVCSALLLVWMAPQHITERLARMKHGPSDLELRNRLAASRDALRVLHDRPWLGAGLGAFETVFPRYQTFASDFRWDHVHNDYTVTLAETGFAGGVLVLSAVGLFFQLAFRNIRERLRSAAGRTPFAATLGCCGVLVHSCADFSLHIPANAAWFAVCAAIATAFT